MIHWRKGVLFVLLAWLSTAPVGAVGQEGQGIDVNGRWVSNASPAGVWTFDLNASGDKLTGRILCDGGEAGPAEIDDGVISGAEIQFKAKNPVAAKTITFKGRVLGNEIFFERSVEIRLDGPIDRSQFAASLDLGVFGSSGPMKFPAIRTGPVPKPDVPITTAPGTINATGRWESLRGNLDVWIVDLKADGAMVTGSVSNTPGPGRQQMVNNRVGTIYDGKIEGAAITFKCKSPDNVRTLTFKGVVQGDEIAFTRGVEIPVGGAFGPDSIFSAYASGTFLARRNTRGLETPAMTKLKQAQFQWLGQSVRIYEYTVSFICASCTLPRGPLPQRVNESVVGPAAPSQTGGSLNQATALREMFFGNRGSIDAVFNLMSAYAATHPFLLEAEYDPKLGYPVRVEIHPGGISSDDNLRIEISAFKVRE